MTGWLPSTQIGPCADAYEMRTSDRVLTQHDIDNICKKCGSIFRDNRDLDICITCGNIQKYKKLKKLKKRSK